MVRPTASNLTDERLDHIAAVLDDIFRVPGTQIRFGLDFLIGWIPGLGDALSGLASLIIIVGAWRGGAALVTLIRMITNVVLESIVGSIPVVGDVFHVAWKANRRNYRLWMREKNRIAPQTHVLRDVLFLGSLAVGFLCLVAVPIMLLVMIVRSLKVLRG